MIIDTAVYPLFFSISIICFLMLFPSLFLIAFFVCLFVFLFLAAPQHIGQSRISPPPTPCFSEPHSQPMEIPRLGVESQLQLLAYTTATTPPDPSRIYDLHHSSRQHQILNPLSGARDQTHNLMVPSRIHFCCAMTGTPKARSFNPLCLAGD